MNYRNAAVVSVLAGMMAGCAYLPTGHSSRSGHAAGQANAGASTSKSLFKTSDTEQLFVSDSNSQLLSSESDANGALPSTNGLRIRKSKRGNMESYVVRGQRYHTLDSSDGYSARGLASWYGPNFHGRTASNGEVYDMYKMTAAHKTLPLPTYARVTHLDNGKSIVVKINDRGPFSGDRIIDLSFSAALELGMVNDGTAMVEIQALSPQELVVLSGPRNSLGVDFYYESGVAEGQPLPTTELFTADSAPEVQDDQSNVVVAIPGQRSAAELSVDSQQATAGQVVPVDSGIVGEAADVAGDGGFIDVDIAALDTDYLEVVVPGRNSKSATALFGNEATAKTSAEDDVVVVDEPAIIEVAAVETSAGVAAEPQRVQVPLIETAAVGQALPAAGVAAMMTAKETAPVSDMRYYIQAGVYADVLDAEKIAVDIVLEIPSEEVHVKPLKDSRMYRITVGPIVNNQHAKEVAAKLNTVGIENYTVKVKE